MKTPFVSIVAISLLVGQTAGAADLSQWSNLQVLKPAQRVGIIQADKKRIEGRFLSASGTAITIEAGGPIEFKVDQVVRVYRPRKLNRPVSMAIGAGIGAAVGGVIAGTASKRFENEGQTFGGIEAAGWVAICIAAGAGIGFITDGNYHTIYQRHK